MEYPDYNKLRSMASKHDWDLGSNPTKEELQKAYERHKGNSSNLSEYDERVV